MISQNSNYALLTKGQSQDHEARPALRSIWTSIRPGAAGQGGQSWRQSSPAAEQPRDLHLCAPPSALRHWRFKRTDSSKRGAAGIRKAVEDAHHIRLLHRRVSSLLRFSCSCCCVAACACCVSPSERGRRNHRLLDEVPVVELQAEARVSAENTRPFAVPMLCKPCAGSPCHTPHLPTPVQPRLPDHGHLSPCPISFPNTALAAKAR